MKKNFAQKVAGIENKEYQAKKAFQEQTIILINGKNLISYHKKLHKYKKSGPKLKMDQIYWQNGLWLENK